MTFPRMIPDGTQKVGGPTVAFLEPDPDALPTNAHLLGLHGSDWRDVHEGSILTDEQALARFLDAPWDAQLRYMADLRAAAGQGSDCWMQNHDAMQAFFSTHVCNPVESADTATETGPETEPLHHLTHDDVAEIADYLEAQPNTTPTVTL